MMIGNQENLSILENRITTLENKVTYLYNSIQELKNLVIEMKFTKNPDDIREHCIINYPNLFNSLFFQTKDQLNYLVPKKDRIGVTKADLVVSLILSLKRKSLESNELDVEYLLLDKVKLNKIVLDEICENYLKVKEEWNKLLNDKLI